MATVEDTSIDTNGNKESLSEVGMKIVKQLEVRESYYIKQLLLVDCLNADHFSIAHSLKLSKFCYKYMKVTMKQISKKN